MRRVPPLLLLPFFALSQACQDTPTRPVVEDGSWAPAYGVSVGPDLCAPPGFVGPGTADGFRTAFFFCITVAVTDGVASMVLNTGEGSLSTISNPVWVFQPGATLSRFDEPFPNRRERGGYIVEQPSGRIEFVEYRYLTPDGKPGGVPELCVTPFDSGLEQEIQNAGGKILGQVHSHPIQRGSVPNPGTCNRWEPKGDGTYAVRPVTGDRLEFRSGPSPADRRRWEQGITQWPGYMISPDRLYRWERKGPNQKGLANRDDYKLKKGAGSCIPR